MRYLFPLLLLLSACASVRQSDAPAGPRAKLGEEFTLALGDSIPLDGTDYTIVFRAVLEDSRCGTGHTCVWEGNARISVGLLQFSYMGETPDGKTLVEPLEEMAELNTSPRFPTSDEGDGVTIELRRLEPAPRADAPTSGYVATLFASKS